MVWHIRLLSPPHFIFSSPHTLAISAALTLTTDLNEAFHPGTAELSAQLWQRTQQRHQQDSNAHILDDSVLWHKVGEPERLIWKAGARALKTRFARHLWIESGENSPRGQMGATVMEWNSHAAFSGRKGEEGDSAEESECPAAFILHVAPAIPNPSFRHKYKAGFTPKRQVTEHSLRGLPIPEVLDVWSDAIELEEILGPERTQNGISSRRVQRRRIMSAQLHTGTAGGRLGVRETWERLREGSEGEGSYQVAKRARRRPLVVLEDLGESIARHVWDAGLTLSIHLGCLVIPPLAHLTDGSMPDSRLATLLRQAGNTLSPIHAIELGSGTGIAGLALSQLLPEGSHVMLTDLPEAQELLEANKNENILEEMGVDVKVGVLNWEEPLPDTIREMWWNLVLVTDCTYNDCLPDLVEVLGNLAISGNRKEKDELNDSKTLVVVAMKVRHASEAVFFDLMKERGFLQLEHICILMPDHQRANLGLELEQIEIYEFQLG